MADSIDIGGLKMTVTMDTSDLSRGEAAGTKSLQTLADAGDKMSKQFQQVDNVVADTGSTFVSFSNSLGSTATKSREYMDTLINPFKGAMPEAMNAWLQSSRGIFDRFSQMTNSTFSGIEYQMAKYGMQNGVVSAVLKKTGDDFVLVTNQSKGMTMAINNLTNTTGALSQQMGALSPQVAQVANTMQLLTMGSIAGAAVYGLQSLINAGNDYAKSLIKIDDSARAADMSLSQYQITQKSLQLTGNLSTDSFAKGTAAIAQNIYEMGQKENDLSKLLDANNIKYKEGEKVILTTNDAIRVMADLIKNAVSGSQENRIAKAFGVDDSWIESLRQGSDELHNLAMNSSKFASTVDAEMIQKAREFSRVWRQATDEALIWIQNWAMDTIDYLQKNNPIKSVNSPDTQQAVTDMGRLLQIAFDKDSWLSGKDEQEIYAIFRRMRDNLVGAFADAKTQISQFWEETFGENAASLMRARIYDLTKLREEAAKLLVGYQGTYVSPGPDQGLRNAPAPGNKTTKDAPADDSKSTEALQRRLDQVRKAIATEDEAYAVQRETWLKDVQKFEDAKLITQRQGMEMQAQIQDKYEKQIHELTWSRLEESVAHEDEILAHKYQKQLADLQTFEDNQTITKQKAEELRQKMMQKYAIDTTQIAARNYAGLADIVDTSMNAITQIVGDQANQGFTVMKAISMATALVKGFEAAVSAYAFGAKIGGPPLGAAMAAVAAAGTAAIIAKLAGVGPNTSGSAGSVASAAGSSGGTGSVASAPADTYQGKTIEVSGLGSSKRYSDQDVRDLINAIETYRKDGDVVIVK